MCILINFIPHVDLRAQTKALVEKLPSVVKKGVTKEEAEQIIAKFKEIGATIVME
jgi:large subunit ribosomal protein L7/L12